MTRAWGWRRLGLGLSVVVVLAGCGFGIDVLSVPHARVSAAQVAAIERVQEAYADTFIAAPIPKDVCSVDVLGAEHRGRVLHVWTAIQCTGVAPGCQATGDSYTLGLAADLDGTRVEHVQRDDGIDGTDLRYDHAYFPRGLWKLEHDLTNLDGDADGHDLAQATATLAGCPRGLTLEPLRASG